MSKRLTLSLHQQLVMSIFLILAILLKLHCVQKYLGMTLSGIFLIKNEIELTFIYLTGHLDIFFGEVAIRGFCPFFNRLYLPFSYCFIEIFISYKSFFRYMYYKYYSPICGLPSLYLNGSIDIQKSMMLMKSNLPLFSFTEIFLCLV